MNRKIAAAFAVLMAILGMAVLAACGGEPPAAEREGPEMGEYYCDSGAEEYTLTLSKGDRYLLVLGGEYSGSYTLSGQNALLALPGGGQASATFYDNYLTLLFGGETYKFYRKIDYTVTYSTDGGTAVPSAVVRNGRAAQRPADPQKDGLIFVGWYSDPALSEMYRFGTPVTGDITLYARYTQPLDPEFTVKFSAEGESFPEVRTKGGMVFDLPVPQQGSGEFAGWWLSHSNRADRLTCRYTGQILRENTTLFAVFSDVTLSVEEKEIVWSAEGYGNFYDLVIKRDGTLVRSESLTVSSYRFDFTQEPMGEYEIELTLNGKETVRAYYRNRALARVSNFRMEGSVMIFGGVADATGYELSAVCGTPEHSHTAVALSGTRFDFSECDMRREGITFTVTARADGFLPSVSEEFVFLRTLSPAAVTVSPDEEIARWERVENAASYDVKILLDGSEVASFNTAATEVSLKEYDAGGLTVSVTPKAFGWNSPAAAEANYTKERLAVPKNVRIEGSAVVWEPVRGALGYEVKIGGQTRRLEEPRLELDNSLFGSASEYPVSVRALKEEGSHSLWSDEIVLRFGTLGGELRYADGQVSWDAAIGAVAFTVEVDGVGQEYGNVTSAPAAFTHAGENLIRVRATFADGEVSGWLTLRVNVYELAFSDTVTGKEVTSYFLAGGDRIPPLPEPEQPGYAFGGWYTAAEGGRRYEESVFTEGKNRTLFAMWTPEIYHVSFSTGVYGLSTPELQAGKDVRFGEEFTFPVPAPTDLRRAFLGWYTQEENGIAYTDYRGGSIGVYSQTGAMTLYARFEIVFDFVQQRDNHGQVLSYQVSKNARLMTCGLPEITIPASYQDRPVLSVLDFTDCTALEVVNIPDSVRNIMVAMQESAFTGCVSLKEINILPGEGGGRYSSDNGVLLYLNTATGRQELKYYPMGKPDTVYRIPDGVQTLPAGVFYNVRTLEEIIVPASVLTVETRAFSFPLVSRGNALKKVTFLPGEGAEPPLGLRSGAFDTCSRLAEVQLPSRVKELDIADVFVNCDGLKNITVAGTGGIYSSEDGLLCKDIPTGKELVYWPIGRQGTFTLPVGITAIGEEALMGRRDITAIVIPGSVSEIGRNAFKDCINVGSITFTGTVWNSALTIGEGAFSGCSNEAITEISLPENLVVLRKDAFAGVKATRVTVNSAKDAPLDFSDGAFGASSPVTTLVIGKSVSNISFVGVFGSKIRNIIVDPGNNNYSTVEGDNVIYNKEMTVIAFFPDDRVGPYTLPVTVTELPANVFKGKANLTEIVLHGALRIIGESAFEKSGLTEIKIPGSVTLIGARAFASCASLTSVVSGNSDGELTISANAFDSCRGLQTVTFGEGLVSLGRGAFLSCAQLSSVSFPASLREIAVGSRDSVTRDPDLALFGAGCLKLSSLTVAAGNTHYGASDGSLYLKAFDETSGAYYNSELMYHIPGAGGEVVLENTVESIWQNAFYYSGTVAERISKISVAGGALAAKGDGTARTLRIGKNAFRGCTATEIALPTGTGVILENAFSNCKTLSSINIPNTVSSISGGAFEGCSALKTVTFDKGNDELPLRFESKAYTLNGGTGIFGTALTSLELPERTIYIGASTFCNNTRLKTLVIPSRVEVIDDFAFYGCKITSLTLDPGGALEAIGASAFNGNMFSSVVIPAGVTRIGYSAFASNRNLSSVTFEDGSMLRELGEKALSGGSYVDVNSVGSVFSGCSSLTDVDFGTGGSLAVLHESTFSGCRRLERLVLPATVETVGKDAFAKCSALTSLTFAVGENSKAQLSEVYPAFSGTGISALVLSESENSITLHSGLLGGSSVKELHLSSSVSSITDLLGDCTTLTSVTVAEENPHFRADPLQPVLYDRVDNSVLCIYGLITDEFRLDESAKEIGAGAFRNQTALTKIVIPRGVEVIGAYAFSGCTALSAVEFAENSALREIGTGAFENCASLGSLDLSETAVTRLGVVFKGCNALETVKFSPFFRSFDLTYVSEANYETPFRNLKALREVDLGMTALTEIPNYLFQDAAALESVKLPATVTFIAKGAFKNCSRLATVNLAFVNSVSDEAFRSCTSLKELDLRRAAFLGKWAFQGCKELLSLDFGSPDQDRSIAIDNQAFENCSSLSDVSLANVTSVGVSSFANCALTEVDLSRLQSAGSSAFKNCALTSVRVPAGVTSWGGTSASTGVFSSNSELTEVTFSTGITAAVNLGHLFGDCKQLKRATFEAGVDLSMGSKGLFEGCSALSEIIIADDGAFKTIPEAMFKGCSALTAVNFPNSVQAVGAEAFSGCSSLYEIALSCSEFAGGVFTGCLSLYSVDLSASAAEELPKELLKDCTALEIVRLPAGITALGASVFEGCRKLSEVVGLDRVLRYGNNCFKGTGLTSVKLSASDTYGTGVFMNCSDLNEIDFGNLSAVPEGMFSGCSSLTAVTLPATVSSLGKEAFKNCVKLKTVALPTGLTSLGEGAFKGCSALSEINLGSAAVSQLPAELFSGCSALQTVSVPNTVRMIGAYAFEESGLTQIDLSATALTQLSPTAETLDRNSADSGAFSGCSKLVTVLLPAGLIRIGGRAFENCVKLTGINLGAVTFLGPRAFFGCSVLSGLDVRSVTEVCEAAFQSCLMLKELEMPALEVIGGNAFYNSGLEGFTLPVSVVAVGSSAFAFSAVQSVTFLCTDFFVTPTSNQKPTGLFASCTALSEVNLPSGLSGIGADWFANCTALTSLVVPRSVVSLEGSAFTGWSQEQTICFEGSQQETEARLGVGWKEGVSATVTYTE